MPEYQVQNSVPIYNVESSNLRKRTMDTDLSQTLQRPSLRSILEVKEVVVMHRDRLARFAIDLLEFIFRQKGTKILVHRQGEDTAESIKQLAEDFLAITTVSVANLTENEHRKVDADESMQGKKKRKI
jgi:predicted site-specific integrase-resolvase